MQSDPLHKTLDAAAPAAGSLAEPDRMYYHSRTFFESSGITPFLEATTRYVAGQQTVPVSTTLSEQSKGEIYFTFTDSLLRRIAQGDENLKKYYEIAMKYGFRGYSQGNKNGIFLLRKQDRNLRRAVERLTRMNLDAVVGDLQISHQAVEGLRGVKIVRHDPSGERVVGLYNTPKSRMIFLGSAHY